MNLKDVQQERKIMYQALIMKHFFKISRILLFLFLLYNGNSYLKEIN